MRHTHLAAGLLLLPTLLLGACASKGARLGAGREFPGGLVQRSVVNVQVLRRDTQVALTNTTDHAFGPGTLWLNRGWSRSIQHFEIGETLDLDLREFKDEFGTPYRAGGFFAAEPPKRLVMAQLETAGPDGTPELVGFIVASEDEE